MKLAPRPLSGNRGGDHRRGRERRCLAQGDAGADAPLPGRAARRPAVPRHAGAPNGVPSSPAPTRSAGRSRQSRFARVAPDHPGRPRSRRPPARPAPRRRSAETERRIMAVDPVKESAFGMLDKRVAEGRYLESGGLGRLRRCRDGREPRIAPRLAFRGAGAGRRGPCSPFRVRPPRPRAESAARKPHRWKWQPEKDSPPFCKPIFASSSVRGRLLRSIDPGM